MKHTPKGTHAWLPYLPLSIPQGRSPFEIAQSELREGLKALGISKEAKIEVLGTGDEYELSDTGDLQVRGGPTGVLYGSYHLLSLLKRGAELPKGVVRPFYPLRMLNHWDNMDGEIERGYAGRSLFFRGNKVSFDRERIHRYARMLASVGINAVSPGNVNVKPPMDFLITGKYLPEIAKLADILRLYGIRLLLTVEFNLPLAAGLATADPLDENVMRFWRERAEETYRHIPDFIGFLVKADSEHRAGPFSYGRTHPEGANMLAQALKPYGGKLFWRCFVYNHNQDWRDPETDRPCAAFMHYAPLDGQFDDNVILQIKNGPLDFQVREPVSPLLFAMPGTKKALELQLAQEYTGQQVDLFYQAKQWQDVFSLLSADRVQFITAVSNLGDDPNWTGHDLAQANLFAYGRTAWYGRSDPEQYALEWAQLAFPCAGKEVADILLHSPDTYEKYVSPLGLGFMVNPSSHCGPSPDGYDYSSWGAYHRADREKVGVDRSARGTGLTEQYPGEIRAMYDDPAICPDKLLLFFHRLPYGHVMRDGRTLIQRIYDDHFEGAHEAKELALRWKTLKGLIPEDTFERVLTRFDRQEKNAREWCDVINSFFFRFSGIPDAKGRKIGPSKPAAHP